jgi:Toastrack DUF4097
MTVPSTLDLTRGRRWALALGLPFVLAAIGFGGLTYVAYAGQDSYRVPPTAAPAGATVAVSVGSGNINISPSPDPMAHLSGSVHYSLIRPSVTWTTTASGLHIKGPDCFWVGNCGATLTLTVPPSRQLQASSGSGNVTARDLDGAATLGAGSGDIRINGFGGASLGLHAGSGNISGSGLASPQVEAHDGSGDVSLSFSQPPDQVTVRASSGNITVVVPAGTAYQINAHTGSGSTHVEVPTDPGSHHVLNLSDGSGNIRVVPAS